MSDNSVAMADQTRAVRTLHPPNRRAKLPSKAEQNKA